MNIINEAGVLALASRLQRLGDMIRKDDLEIYKAHSVDFEPKWFPVIYALHVSPVLSVVEIAAGIGYTHPSTINLLKELELQKLVRSKRDRTDQRKRLVQLTDKGRSLVEQLKPVWRLITAATTDLVDTRNNLMQAILEVEERLSEKSLSKRALQPMPGKKKRLRRRRFFKRV